MPPFSSCGRGLIVSLVSLLLVIYECAFVPVDIYISDLYFILSLFLEVLVIYLLIDPFMFIFSPMRLSILRSPNLKSLEIILCNFLRLQLKWREELKSKELALAQVEEERCSKEAAEASNKRKLEALRLKIEIDFQRHRDDHQRLEQELSRLKLSAQSTELNHQSNNLLTGKSEGAKPQGETIAKLLNELDKLEDSSEKEVNGDRECVICSKDEVSIVFLPCAHQVLCANCNDSYGKKGKATCPCCQVPIEQRIRVFGASS